LQTKRLFVISVSIVAVAAFLVLHIFGLTGIGTRIQFQTISKGIFSGLADQGYHVIQDRDEWARIWGKHQQIMYPQDPLPEVNFSEKTVIAVSMGMRRTTGYGIEIKEIIDTGLSVVVKVEETSPNGRAVGMAITHPFHVVIADRIDKYIIFVQL